MLQVYCNTKHVNRKLNLPTYYTSVQKSLLPTPHHKFIGNRCLSCLPYL